MRGRRQRRCIRAPLCWWKVTKESSDQSEPLPPPPGSERDAGPWAPVLRSEASQGDHRLGRLRCVRDEKPGLKNWDSGPRRIDDGAPANKRQGDWTAEKRADALWNSRGVRTTGGRGGLCSFFLWVMIHLQQDIDLFFFFIFYSLLGNLFANWATDDGELCKVSLKFVEQRQQVVSQLVRIRSSNAAPSERTWLLASTWLNRIYTFTHHMAKCLQTPL